MPLPETGINAGDFIQCPFCSGPIQTEVFPAFFRPTQTGQAGETILVEGEASCFTIPRNGRAFRAQHADGFYAHCAISSLTVSTFARSVLKAENKKES